MPRVRKIIGKALAHLAAWVEDTFGTGPLHWSIRAIDRVAQWIDPLDGE